MKIITPVFDQKELDALSECLNSGWVTQGPYTEKLESLFSKYHKVDYAYATTSCTAALHLGTLSLGLKSGDEVIVPAFTWITSANSAEYVGARAVFTDVNPKTYNIDPASFEAAITKNTKAVVVVHLFGLAADMDAIIDIANANNIKIIEDAACAIGTTYNDVPVGGFGSVGCFSFHPRKVITTGEGGMVTTNEKEIAQRIACLRNHGASPMNGEAKPWNMNNFNILGFNLRMSDIQASVGVAQFDKLYKILNRRKELALRYCKLMENMSEIILPLEAAEYADVSGHSYQSFVIRIRDGNTKRRNSVMQLLGDYGIQTRPGTHAVHRLGYYSNKYNLSPEAFPNACLCEDTTITLPIFHEMKQEDQGKVVELISKGLKHN